MYFVTVRKNQHTNHPDAKIKRLTASWVIPKSFLVIQNRCPRKTKFPEKAPESIWGKNKIGEKMMKECHHSNRQVFLLRETGQNALLPNSKWLLISIYTAHSTKYKLRQGRWGQKRENTLLAGHWLNRQMEGSLLTNVLAHTVYLVYWDQCHPRWH